MMSFKRTNKSYNLRNGILFSDSATFQLCDLECVTALVLGIPSSPPSWCLTFFLSLCVSCWGTSDPLSNSIY